jgi:group I intron endonuclease
MPESIYLIYKHTSPSGKSYIGQTKDYDTRCKRHQQPTSGCPAFSAAISKYGWDNFTHEFLIEHITEDEANTLEVFYIKEHQSLHPKGYNLTTGGDASSQSTETRAKISATHQGMTHTDETKAKLSVIGSNRSAETNAKISAALKGKTFSDAHKAKIAVALTGKPKNKPCFKYIVTSPYGQVFDVTNLTLFCRDNGIMATNMYRVAKGIYLHHKGWTCRRIQ